MSKVDIGLGSNLGDRRRNLENAFRELAEISTLLQVSSIYETPALLPEGSPEDWDRPYLNCVARFETHLDPLAFHSRTLAIEENLGRVRSAHWSPRVIDLDLLGWAGVRLEGPELTLPHPRISERAFVLDPLAEIGAGSVFGDLDLRKLARAHPLRLPVLMGILNLTPDSFSDGGKQGSWERIVPTLDRWDEIGIAWIDIGGESTRPGAAPVGENDEWARVSEVLSRLRERYRNRIIRPKISIDTSKANVAERAITAGVDLVNDVSGLSDLRMIEVIASSAVGYVLTHHGVVRSDPIAAVREELAGKLARLEKAGIRRSRVFIDPGIGFGKKSSQSLSLIRRLDELQTLDCPILCGHSRKSFMKNWTPEKSAPERDPETLGVSFALAAKGVDVLRVHDPVLHHRTFLAHRYALLGS